MFKNLLKGMLSVVAIKLLENYRYLSIQTLKIEATKSYLHGVRAARLSAMGLMCLGLVIALICIGVLMLHVGLFVLLPWTLKSKALLGTFLGLIYVVIGGMMLRSAMNEKSWMDKSGATEMLAEAIGKPVKPEDQ